jgi:Rieske Fe-S protein
MPEETTTNEKRPITRREFMWYAWASSLALFMAGSGGVTLAFMYPRFKAGEFGGEFYMGNVDDYEDGDRVLNRKGKFYLVRVGDEFKALFQVCTHLGCLVRDVPEGYSCPCHGSVFTPDGTLVRSPAPRDMDQFAVTITDGGEIIVDTGTSIRGESRST